MKPLYLLLYLAVLTALSLIQPSSALALPNLCAEFASASGTPGTCDHIDYCNTHIAQCCWPACPYEEWTDGSGCPGSPTNTCCTLAGGCGYNAQCNRSLDQWDYCHGICQVKAIMNVRGQCDYRFRYDYEDCPATDTCSDSPYLYPGLCTGNGCDVGSQVYKTCCKDDGTGEIPCVDGGTYNGTCPAGSHGVIGVGPSACLGVGATPTPGGATPTPGGATPTPLPLCPYDCGIPWAGCTVYPSYRCAAGQCFRCPPSPCGQGDTSGRYCLHDDYCARSDTNANHTQCGDTVPGYPDPKHPLPRPLLRRVA
jgi:hypothetical protein